MADPKHRIINELPDPLPVSAAELALIETYFAAEIFALCEEEQDAPTCDRLRKGVHQPPG